MAGGKNTSTQNDQEEPLLSPAKKHMSDVVEEVQARQQKKYTRGNKISQGYYFVASSAAAVVAGGIALGLSPMVVAVISLFVGPIWAMSDGFLGSEQVKDGAKRSDGSKKNFRERLWDVFRSPMKGGAQNKFDVFVLGGVGLGTAIALIASSIVLKSFVAASATVGAMLAPVGLALLSVASFWGAQKARKSYRELKDLNPNLAAKERREMWANIAAGVGALLLCGVAAAALATPPGLAVMAVGIVGSLCLFAAGSFKLKRLWDQSDNLRPFVRKQISRASSLGSDLGMTKRFSFIASIINGVRSFFGMEPITRRVTRSSSYDSLIDTDQHGHDHDHPGAPIPRANTFSGVASHANQNTSFRPRAATFAGDLSHAQSESVAPHDAGAGGQDAKNAEQSPVKSRWQRAAHQVTSQATTPVEDIHLSQDAEDQIDQRVKNARTGAGKANDDEHGLLAEESI